MKTLFLHIGTRKTATTSIQDFCYKNRAVLESKGYCYPKSAYNFPDVAKERNAHFMVCLMKEGETRDLAEEERIFSLGMENLHKCFEEYDNVVMSDENLWHFTVRFHKQLWKNLKKDAKAYGYTIKIIVYLRRQDEYLNSYWNQMVKTGRISRTSEDFFGGSHNYMLDYAANLNRIVNRFGKENVIVRRFDRDSFYKGSIYEDFFHCIGLELTDEYEELEKVANLGLKGNMVEIMRVINTLPILERDNNKYWRRLFDMCAEASDNDYKCSMFSKEEAEELLVRYREGNEWIAAELIGDGKPLFDYEVKDIPKWKKDNEYMLDDVIRLFATVALDMQAQIETLEEEQEEMKRQLKENRLSMSNISQKGKRYIRRKLGMKDK